MFRALDEKVKAEAVQDDADYQVEEEKEMIVDNGGDVNFHAGGARLRLALSPSWNESTAGFQLG